MFIKIEKEHCLVAGGGQVAWRKVRVLLDFGACVTVVAPQIIQQIRELESVGVQICVRAFEEADLEGCTMVVAATDDAGENHRIAELAKSRRIPVNAVDQQEDCTFIFPSYVREQNLVGAFSSGGNSPVITQYLKAKLAEELTGQLGQINEYMGSIRELVKERVDTERLRKQVYQTVLEELLCDSVESLPPDRLEQIIDNTYRKE
jgi:uroporphyrin-III C-methyltransferase/precorrin-2 dehydrogenase/sirohydrochlorin ferrochelatase/precorrin-2 dehydrogenase/sirohydrochlorin ferrochelatase